MQNAKKIFSPHEKANKAYGERHFKKKNNENKRFNYLVAEKRAENEQRSALIVIFHFRLMKPEQTTKTR